MTYCKYCGMESKYSAKCEWCGRQLAAPAPASVGPTDVPPEIQAIRDKAAAGEEADRRSLVGFFVSCAALVAIASGLVIWKFSLYPWVTVISLFIAGGMLGYFRIIPSFEHEWAELAIPLILLVKLPALFVFAAYMAYGLLARNIDMTVAWLLSVHLAVLTLLQVAASTGLSHSVSISSVAALQGVGSVGLGATVFGWVLSTLIRPLDQ